MEDLINYGAVVVVTCILYGMYVYSTRKEAKRAHHRQSVGKDYYVCSERLVVPQQEYSIATKYTLSRRIPKYMNR